MNKFFLTFLISILIASNILCVGKEDMNIEGGLDDIILFNNNTLSASVLEQCFCDQGVNGPRNISKSSLFKAALNNSNKDAMQELLMYAQNNGFRLLEHSEEGSI